MKNAYWALGLILMVTVSCQKKNEPTVDINTKKKDILNDIAYHVCAASYADLHAKALTLENQTLLLQSSPNDAQLALCRQAWKDVRLTWERTESWLFGPISANNIDPRIDTWPVDFNAIDSVLNTSAPFTETYVDNLEDALKGFHPIEYFLWGSQGNKTASSFTPRQLEYLVALTFNLRKLCTEVHQTWENGYANEVATAGNGSNSYSSVTSAYIELVDAMSGICDEVANGKMNTPFIAQDPTLEESPFAQNSLNDFTNNIQGVMMLYKGQYATDKLGIEDLVLFYNTSLDQEIKTSHAEAVAALQAISSPFGDAILSQPILVQNAMDKINALEAILSTQLKPFLLQHIP